MKKKDHCHGFLYCPDSQQFLLQQKTDGEHQIWTLVEDLTKFRPKAVLPVYDYVVKGEKHVVCYAEVRKQDSLPSTKNQEFKWFTIKEISKLPMSVQTKQDIIVGRRVIDSQIRKDAGERTIG